MLALIPARGGSKALPQKNIKPLNGKPLLAYTIKAAQDAKDIDRIILSTDDKSIARIGKEWGAEVPFLRPSDLATDTAHAIDTYLYTINRLQEIWNREIIEFAVLLPTSPLRIAYDVNNAIDIFYSQNADSVISVAETRHPPTWAKKIDNDGVLQNYFNFSLNNENRQKSLKAYMPNGAIYIFKFELLKTKYTYYSRKTYPYIMPPERSIDIDTYFDFIIANYLLRES